MSPSPRGIKGEVHSTLTQAEKSNRYLYNKSLRPLASALRKKMTKAEACLWKFALRAGTMRGHTFNRQRPVKGYIVDFLCKTLLLVIEVDGITHSAERSFLRDQERERILTNAGFMIIRFTDQDVLTNIDGVRQALESRIEERERELGLLPLHPLNEGDSILS
jgi:very-short-patch-repair endonuclease